MVVTFADSLEQKCRKMIGRQYGKLSEGPLGSIWREIALVLSHIDHIHLTRDNLLKEQLKLELRIENRILGLRALPHEPHDSWIQKTQLKASLLHSRVRLEMQRHRILMDHARELQKLQDRLLELWNRSYECQLDDGRKRTTGKTRTADA